MLGQEPQEKLEIRLCPDGSGQLYVPGLTEFRVQSVEDINKVQGWGAWRQGSAGETPRRHRAGAGHVQPLPLPLCNVHGVTLLGDRVSPTTSLRAFSVSAPWQVFEFGHTNRTTEFTNLNEHSSRSHALLIVTVRGVDCSTGLRTTGE